MRFLFLLLVSLAYTLTYVSATHKPTPTPTLEPTKKMLTSPPTPSAFTLQV